MVEAVWAESVETPSENIMVHSPIEKRPSLRAERTSLTLVSPSVGRRMKGQRGINGKCRLKIKNYSLDSTLKF